MSNKAGKKKKVTSHGMLPPQVGNEYPMLVVKMYFTPYSISKHANKLVNAVINLNIINHEFSWFY